MKIKYAAPIFLASMMLLASATVFAEDTHPVVKTVTAEDGLITIDLPNDKWYAITTDEHTAEFSDGDCGIILNIYHNTNGLPQITVADQLHAKVYETVGSTTEYVYTITGLTNSEDDYNEVKKAVNSAQIDMSKITDNMIDKTIAVEEYSISETNYSAWVNVNDGLNVRSGSSAEATLVGTLERGDKVTVVGVVLHKGIENGWVKIKTDNLEGYASAQFLSTTEVAKESKPEVKKDATRTGDVKTLYFSDGSAVNVYLYTDGNWKSDSGVVYWSLTDYEWANDRGNTLYVTRPDTNPASRTGETMTLYHGNGNREIIYEYTDGSWRDETGISYGGWPGNGYMTSASGETLYTYDPTPEYDADDNQNLILVSENGDQTVIYSDGAADGSWTDNNKRYYRYNAFGTWICDGVYYYEQQ